MKNIVIATIIASATATASFAGSVKINGHAHDACVEYNGNLSGTTTVTINGGAQRGYVVDTSTGRNCSNRTSPNTNTGSSFDSDKDRHVSRVQVQGNDLVVSVTNQDPDGFYTKEHRVTLPTNTGAKGETGETGAQGVQGIQGERGETGSTGATGSQGERGERGETGSQGVQGVQGVQGERGEQGIQGERGQQGVAGINGTNGTDGTDGQDGQDGQDGIDGQDGANGIDGQKGDKGEKGEKGTAAVAPMSGLSLIAATSSFSGDGLGLGMSTNNGNLEFSIAGGAQISKTGRVVIAVTFDENGRTEASAGIGWSF